MKEIKNISDIDEFALIDFYTDNCGACKIIAPILEKNKGIYGATFYKMNLTNNKWAIEKFNLASVPTLILLKNRKEIARHVGFISEKVL